MTRTNYTQVPNILFDLMPHISMAQFAVLMTVARQTYGWQKTEDTISLSQFAEKTGLSLSGTRQAIGAMVLHGFLLRRTVGTQNLCYMIDLDRVARFLDKLCHSVTQSDSELCHSVTQLDEKLCNSETQLNAELCHSVTTQKKELKEKEQKKDVSFSSSFNSTATAKTPDEGITQVLQQWQNATAAANIKAKTNDKAELRRLCAMKQYGVQAVADAIAIAQNTGKLSVGYVKGVLGSKPQAPPASAAPKVLSIEQWLSEKYNHTLAYMVDGRTEEEVIREYEEYKQQAEFSPNAVRPPVIRGELGFSLSSI